MLPRAWGIERQCWRRAQRTRSSCRAERWLVRRARTCRPLAVAETSSRADCSPTESTQSREPWNLSRWRSRWATWGRHWSARSQAMACWNGPAGSRRLACLSPCWASRTWSCSIGLRLRWEEMRKDKWRKNKRIIRTYSCWRPRKAVDSERSGCRASLRGTADRRQSRTRCSRNENTKIKWTDDFTSKLISLSHVMLPFALTVNICCCQIDEENNNDDHFWFLAQIRSNSFIV